MLDRTRLRTTWDGLFISEEPPHGVTVIVYRRDHGAGPQFLVLHRRGATGDWAWGPPAGARLPGEDVEACASRELEATTGLRLPLHALPHDPEWASFCAEAGAGHTVVLGREHDRAEWVTLDEAMQRCQPAIVAEQFQTLANAVAA